MHVTACLAGQEEVEVEVGKTAAACRRFGKPSSENCRSCASRGSTCLSADVLSTTTRASFRWRRTRAWTWCRTPVYSAFVRCVRLAVRSPRKGCLSQLVKVMCCWSRCTLMLGCRLTVWMKMAGHLFTSRARTGMWSYGVSTRKRTRWRTPAWTGRQRTRRTSTFDRCRRTRHPANGWGTAVNSPWKVYHLRRSVRAA